MFEAISSKLDGILARFQGRHRLTEKNIQEGLREVRLALLEADVNYRVARDFVERVKERALGQEVIESVSPGQQIVKVFHDELTDLMGPVDHTIPKADKGPTVIMLVGLQGSGKTTTAAKLARYLQSRGRNPMLVAADVQRPAAIEQLIVLGEQVHVPVYSEPDKRPPEICKHAINEAPKRECDTVIFDTAGRLHIDAELMAELREIRDGVKPHQIYLVCDAMTGQDAVNSAKEFNEQLDLDGVILTKLDGDARGGAALSIKAVTGKPIKFVGVGEKLDRLEEFHPDRMASRILGMGDVVSLIEKAQEAADADMSEEMEERLRKAEFTLEDFQTQMEQVRKMGGLSSILGMLPGAGQLKGLKDMDVDDSQVDRINAIINSMTLPERRKPSILNGGRRQRIADGSGTSVTEVNQLVKQFTQAKKLMKQMQKQQGKGGRGLRMPPGLGPPM